MSERLKTTFWLLGYTFLAGLFLTLFAQISEIYRYLFSLSTLYLGIRFFRKYDTLSLRILFFVLTILFYLFTTVITAIVIFIREHPEAISGT